MKNKFKVAVAIVSVAITGIASAANTCPVKFAQPNDEVSQHIKAIINGENGNSNNSVEVKHIELPPLDSGDGTFDTFVGGFKFIDADTLTQFGNEVLRNDIKKYTPDIYAEMQAFEKAIANPTLKNVTDLKRKQNELESMALTGLAQGIVNTYNMAQKIAVDQPLTVKEQSMMSQSNYPIVAAVAKLLKNQTFYKTKQSALDNNGIYKGISDNSCNYGVGCNELIAKSHYLYASEAMGSNQDIDINKQIISGSHSYAFNLALLSTSPKVYQALKDTKNQAYQQAQLAMLTDIDLQLRKLNQ